jgi:dipeptidase E
VPLHGASDGAYVLPLSTRPYRDFVPALTAAAATFGETYTEPRTASGTALTSEEMTFATPEGDVSRTFITTAGAGFVDFAVIPHLANPNHPDASLANAERWAAKLPVPTYAIDDQSAVVVADGAVDIATEGTWRLFPLL